MKLFATAILLSSFQLTSAWRIRLYQNTGYQVLIVDQSDFFSTTCNNIDASLNDQISSLHWENEGVFGPCTINLYRNKNCGVNIGRSARNWDRPRFSEENDDQVSSWRVDCPGPEDE